MNQQLQCHLKTPLGQAYLIATPKGLQGVYFKKQAAPFSTAKSSAADILTKATTQFEEYFAGRRTKFDLPLDLKGTKFQKSVWRALLSIPYGTTCSYKDLAAKVHNKKAFRAVGTANGKNPLCIIVPCHRVIAADGTLGGYSGGLDKKKKLLAIEGLLKFNS